jgi:hypothetical protein
MTTDDQRYTLREAADLTDKSADTLRRWVKNGKLPGAGKHLGDPTGTICTPASALIAAGLLAAGQLADGEPEAGPGPPPRRAGARRRPRRADHPARGEGRPAGVRVKGGTLSRASLPVSAQRAGLP